MYYKLHKTKEGHVLAAADEDLMGKHLKFNDTDFFVNPRFYGDKKAAKEWLIKEMQSPGVISVNLIGKESVQMGIDAGIIDKSKIVKIGKVPHAQGFLIF
ncbi:MAG TPA: DUF424 family protein [Candidatus Nanoarchaeia archaeon]|nr:DUF424 family protein [Candidatus Nanoarchaeia archaeon]